VIKVLLVRLCVCIVADTLERSVEYNRIEYILFSFNDLCCT